MTSRASPYLLFTHDGPTSSRGRSGFLVQKWCVRTLGSRGWARILVVVRRKVSVVFLLHLFQTTHHASQGIDFCTDAHRMVPGRLRTAPETGARTAAVVPLLRHGGIMAVSGFELLARRCRDWSWPSMFWATANHQKQSGWVVLSRKPVTLRRSGHCQFKWKSAKVSSNTLEIG